MTNNENETTPINVDMDSHPPAKPIEDYPILYTPTSYHYDAQGKLIKEGEKESIDSPSEGAKLANPSVSAPPIIRHLTCGGGSVKKTED